MNKHRIITFVAIASIAVIVAVSLPLTSARAETGHEHHDQTGKMDMKKDMKEHPKTDVLSLEKIHSKHVPMVSKAIEKAIEAIEAGNSKDALVQLHKAQKMIVSINEAIGKHVKPKFVNVRCPIMGSPINPDKVTAKLIREYKGQKVALCCADCPKKWDKLTDNEKDAKLAKAKAK